MCVYIMSCIVYLLTVDTIQLYIFKENNDVDKTIHSVVIMIMNMRITYQSSDRCFTYIAIIKII